MFFRIFYWYIVPLCNQFLSPLMLWVRISIKARCTTLCDKVCHWLATGRWFSRVSFTNKIDRHDIAEILLKVAVNTIKQANKQTNKQRLTQRSKYVMHIQRIISTIYHSQKSWVLLLMHIHKPNRVMYDVSK